MNSMKVLSVLVVASIALGAGLILFTNNAEASDDINVCVTFPWQKEMLQWIGGDNIRVTQLVGPGADPHSGEGTISDLIAASKSIAYFYIGSNMEWEVANLPLLQSSFPNMAFVNVSEGLTLLATAEGHHDDDDDDDHEGDHSHGPIDPHVWTSPSNLLVMAENVKNALVELDPDNTSTYESGYESYIGRVNEIKSLADELFEDKGGNKFLVWHSAWQYLCRDYNITEISFESSYSGGVTTQVIADIIEEANEEGLNTIFIRPSDPLWADNWRSALTGGSLIVEQGNPLAIQYLDELESFITKLNDSWGDGEA